MAALEKVFQCLTCKQNIKLERKPDNSGWIRYNLDGTKHVDFNNKKSSSLSSSATTTKLQQRQDDNNNQITNSGYNPNKVLVAETQIATLAEMVSILTRKIDTLSENIRQLSNKVDNNQDMKKEGDED